MMQPQVLLSTDPGIDDALAIIFLSKLNSLKAIWTTMGNATLEKTTHNAMRLLNILNQRQIPIIKGAVEPLSGAVNFTADIHGSDGLGNSFLPLPDLSQFSWRTINFISASLTEDPHEITLVSVGPLTNLALLIQKVPQKIISLFKEIIIMGGAVSVPGNITPYAEFNIHCDPKAAKIVFSNGCPLTLVGLDVTHKAIMTEEHIRLIEAKPTPLTKFLVQIIRFYAKFHTGLNGCYLHDPLAAAVALDNSLVKKKTCGIDILIDDPLKRGQTIVVKDTKSANISVCVELNIEKFLKFFITALLK
jgi:purine nucleosidase